jgi:hypothetical protein
MNIHVNLYGLIIDSSLLVLFPKHPMVWVAALRAAANRCSRRFIFVMLGLLSFASMAFARRLL